MEKVDASIVLSELSAELASEEDRDELDSWVAYVAWRIGKVYPGVVVTTSPTTVTDVIDAPTSAQRVDLRERLEDAWDAWCGGDRAPEWTIQDLLDMVAREEGSEAIHAIVQNGYDDEFGEHALAVLIEAYGSKDAAIGAINAAARARLS
jgi:hypothetical protein